MRSGYYTCPNNSCVRAEFVGLNSGFGSMHCVMSEEDLLVGHTLAFVHDLLTLLVQYTSLNVTLLHEVN